RAPVALGELGIAGYREMDLAAEKVDPVGPGKQLRLVAVELALHHISDVQLAEPVQVQSARGKRLICDHGIIEIAGEVAKAAGGMHVAREQVEPPGNMLDRSVPCPSVAPRPVAVHPGRLDQEQSPERER